MVVIYGIRSVDQIDRTIWSYVAIQVEAWLLMLAGPRIPAAENSSGRCAAF